MKKPWFGKGAVRITSSQLGSTDQPLLEVVSSPLTEAGIVQHARSGWFSEPQAIAIILHEEYGEAARLTVTSEMLAAA